MRLYVIRHGESESNKNGVLTGWVDAPLTDKGRSDARRAGEFLRGVTFDKVYSSDLSRAVETASIAYPDTVPETRCDLREINLGILAGKGRDSLSDEERAAYSSGEYKSVGGESREEFVERVRLFLSEISSLECERIAVFAHAGVLRTFMDLIVGTRLSRARVICKNCAVGIFEYSADAWKIHSYINLD